MVAMQPTEGRSGFERGHDVRVFSLPDYGAIAFSYNL
jgi:hypothetical protein